MNWQTDIYDRAPWWLQNVACSTYGWKVKRQRYDRTFCLALEETLDRKSLSGVDLEAWLSSQLRAHFRAARRSPFWRARFADAGIPDLITEPFKAIQQLPILSKDDVHANRGSIQTNTTEPQHSVQTGGTTGAGLAFVETQQCEALRWATWWRYRLEHGIAIDTWSAHFSGKTVVGTSLKKPPFHRWNLPGRQILFDPIALTEAHAPHYMEAIDRLRLPWVHGYPSVIAELAGHALAHNIAPPAKVRIVTTGAENLTAQQRETISNAFDAPVFDHYGLAETVANFSQLPDGNYYVDEDLAFVEFVPLGADHPGLYRVIGTNFHNPAFPLFRYDTDDLVYLDEEPPFLPAANWSRRVTSLDGRQADFIPLPDGRRGGPFNHIFKVVTTITAAQVYQPTLNRAIFRVVRSPRYQHPDDTDRLLAEARRRLGKDIELEVQFVDELQRRPNGKLPLVISDVS